MFSSIIYLRMANWEKWTKFFTDLLVLVLAYTISVLTVTSFTFFMRSERNTFTFISLCMDHVLMAKILRVQLRHYTCLIKLTLLQLRHRTSLTKPMFNTRAPLMLIALAPLMLTTRAHYIYVTCSKLALFHSNIPFHSLVSVHLQIRPVSQLIYHLLPPTQS